MTEKYAKYSSGPVSYGSNGRGAIRPPHTPNRDNGDSCGKSLASFILLAVTAVSFLMQYV